MKASLKIKTIIMIVCIAATISIMAIIIYKTGIHDVIESQYEDRSIDIARLVAVEIDTEKLLNVQKAVREIYDHVDNRVYSDQWGTPEFEEYVSQFTAIEDMEDYQKLRSDLRKMQDVLNVDCLYITWLDVENRCNVYLVDAAYEDACPIGCIDPLFTDDEKVFENRESGFPPNISNTPEYGWLISTGMPVVDDKGEFIAISAVDISMNDIMSQQNHFLLNVLLAFLILTIIVCVIAIMLVNRAIIKPINTLSQAAEEYTHNKKAFSELQISRNDEIGVLANSMTHMEEDINGYISNLEKTTNDLISARERAEQMDKAANIDALTKVRNKRAFDLEVQRLNDNAQPYGIVMIDMNGLKFINDTYGHEKGDVSIKTLCQIICWTFVHSPVYRVGGDEFVVILENCEEEERNALLQSISDTFQKQYTNESLQPWERVTAAIGFAEYDPAKDSSVESVMKRADTAMYENKRDWKEKNEIK